MRPARDREGALDEGGVRSELVNPVDVAAASDPAEGQAPWQNILDAFPQSDDLVATFHRIWGQVEEHVEVSLTSDEALGLLPSLVIYDMPDGTRSTLSVSHAIDVGLDAGLYCAALLHVLRGLGVRRSIVMTHTAYNRERGDEGFRRILRIVSHGTKPVQRYVRRTGLNVHLVGLPPGYELEHQLTRDFPQRKSSGFDAYFLVNYAEDLTYEETFRDQLAALPEVDVCVRHTKFNMSGGWIPGKLLKSTFLYCQNGTLFTNWRFDELVALTVLSLLSKVFHGGEGLVKMYGDLDEVKRRYQMRELRLFNQRIQLRPRPRKLFVLGSPMGLLQFYY